jgi:two-component system, NtrC family, response regulator HydG
MSKPPIAETGTVSLPVDRPSANSTVSFVLLVDGGPDQGSRFVVHPSTPSRTLVGTSPACSLRLTDRSVSRRHAALDVAGNRLKLTDVDSTNGTFVNGIAIVECYLDGGEFVRVGSTLLHVQRVDETVAEPLSARTCFGKMQGASEQMRRLYPLCEKLARSDVPVVIEGQTGTGKEVLAESLHEMGPRANGPFVVFDCTTVPASLAESELFGHEKGAFTGAVSAHKGLFEQAHEGTLLIDEIGDLDLQHQPKLLRAIQRNEIKRVGGSKLIKVDVRVLAATRRDLDREVQSGRFRDDLFFRLNVGRIELPPLSQRQGDVALLTRYFWEQFGAQRPVPQRMIEQFEAYDWPGNVRELYNAVSQYHALGDLARFDRAPRSTLPDGVPSPSQSEIVAEVLGLRLPLTEARQRVIADFEQRYLEHMLDAHGGNVTHAAAAAGVGRRYFHALIARRAGPER